IALLHPFPRLRRLPAVTAGLRLEKSPLSDPHIGPFSLHRRRRLAVRTHTVRDSRCGELSSYILLTCGLSICMGLLLHDLDHDYIVPWDEVVHITVVHNLYSDCCDPKLHRIDLGQTEQSDWTNNYIWLHKPPLPFYLRAALYRVFGESL